MLKLSISDISITLCVIVIGSLSMANGLFQLRRQRDMALGKNIVMVIGDNVGNEQTEFIKFIASDLSTFDSADIGHSIGKLMGEYHMKNSDLDEIHKDRLARRWDDTESMPIVIRDERRQVDFYDFPVFSEARNNSAIQMEMKKIFNDADKVKMLFVESHRMGRDSIVSINTDKFKQYLEKASILKDFDKYKDGIAYILTKVHLRNRDDNVHKENAANFLRKVREDLMSNKAKYGSWADNAIKLLNVLLTKENGVYTKIGLYYNVDREGNLNDNDFMKDVQNKLNTLVHDKLKYVTSDVNDFISVKMVKRQPYVNVEDEEYLRTRPPRPSADEGYVPPVDSRRVNNHRSSSRTSNTNDDDKNRILRHNADI